MVVLQQRVEDVVAQHPRELVRLARAIEAALGLTYAWRITFRGSAAACDGKRKKQ
jgi:hypothetical protein